MLAHPPQDPSHTIGHRSIAWPQALLHNANGKFAGFTMPFVADAHKLIEIYNPTLRKSVAPDFNRKYLHRTARNLASGVAAIHHHGYVIGDINESNVLVTSRALITIIDVDSFQVANDTGKLYLCKVGRPEYTPPDLVGKDLGQTPRTPIHDRFGLAVLIFQLLMSGSHPFRSRWLGSGDPPRVAEKIFQGLYPHIPNATGLIGPPSAMSPVDTLHPNLVTLFTRCFAEGHHQPSHRPTAKEWERALQEAEECLAQCAQGHHYSDHLSQCPYCQIKTPRPTLLPSQVSPPHSQHAQQTPIRGIPIAVGVLLLAFICGIIITLASQNTRPHTKIEPTIARQAPTTARAKTIPTKIYQTPKRISATRPASRPPPTRPSPTRPSPTKTKAPVQHPVFYVHDRGLRHIGQTVIKGQVFDRNGNLLANGRAQIGVTIGGNYYQSDSFRNPQPTNSAGWYEMYVSPDQEIEIAKLFIDGQQVPLEATAKWRSRKGTWWYVDIRQR